MNSSLLKFTKGSKIGNNSFFNSIESKLFKGITGSTNRAIVFGIGALPLIWMAIKATAHKEVWISAMHGALTKAAMAIGAGGLWRHPLGFLL